MTDYQPEHAPKKTHPLLSNKTYDQLKKLVTLGLPAFGTLYIALADLWALPNPEAVAGSCLALATFFGVILNLAGRTYTPPAEQVDGEIVVSTNDEGVKQAALILKNYENPAEVVAQEKVTFVVRQEE